MARQRSLLFLLLKSAVFVRETSLSSRRREGRKGSASDLTPSIHNESLFVSFKSAINWFPSVTSQMRGQGDLLPGYSIWQLRIDWQVMCHPDNSTPQPATFLSELDGPWSTILMGQPQQSLFLMKLNKRDSSKLMVAKLVANNNQGFKI